MTQAELYTALLTTGLPVAYGSFDYPQAPPFIAYKFAYSDDVMADNQNFVEAGYWQIELYTDKKDAASEKLVQDLLKSLRLPYGKTETRIDTEKLYQVVYETKIIGG